MPPDDPSLLDESCDAYPRIEEAFQAALDESLKPRGLDFLYEMVGKLGLPAGASVVDLGCGVGKQSIELARRFDFAVHGIDPARRHMELANEALDANSELRELVRFQPGTAESMPVEDSSVDLIWCREVLVLVEALDAAFAECRRVLRGGGRMLIHDTFRTDRLQPGETEGRAAAPGADGKRIEAAFTAAGFEVEERIELASEWGEWGEEKDGRAGRRLIHAARLLRDPERYIAQFGQSNYDIMLGDCLWHVYRMIGKLSGRVYVLRAP